MSHLLSFLMVLLPPQVCLVRTLLRSRNLFSSADLVGPVFLLLSFASQMQDIWTLMLSAFLPPPLLNKQPTFNWAS